MATNHEHYRLKHIATSLEEMARRMESEAKSLRDFGQMLRDIPSDSTPLNTAEKFNIRGNTRRAAFQPLQSSGLAVSVETIMLDLDRLVEEDD